MSVSDSSLFGFQLRRSFNKQHQLDRTYNRLPIHRDDTDIGDGADIFRCITDHGFADNNSGVQTH